jgi:hypothetical protein
MGTWIEIHDEIRGSIDRGWQLCFQRCTYHYPPDERPENVESDQSGFRFIWRRPDGKLSATRGQARLPDADQTLDLLHQAHREGWFRASYGEFA